MFFSWGGIHARLNDTRQVPLPSNSPTSSSQQAANSAHTLTGASGASDQEVSKQRPLTTTAATSASIVAHSIRLPLVTTSGAQQAISLATSTIPHIGSARLYCDTLKTTLVINYTNFGTHPVAITRIALNVEPVLGVSVDPCRIDPLSSQPKGISLRNSYIFTLRDSGNVGKYIISGNIGAASDVKLDNILETSNGTQTITLKPTEKPIVRDVYVNSIASEPQKVWFTLYYDADGEKTIDTSPLYISPSQ